MIDTSYFDLSNVIAETGNDPFADTTKKYDTDDRFYKLERNENDAGVAVIRFLPDSERGLFQQVYKINTTIVKNGKSRFVSELSPQTIGKPCPFQEEWANLWNAGDKDGAKAYSRSTRYFANIKVIKDPANPANEGKIFLLDVSKTLKDKIQSIMQPSQEEIALGNTAKELFNPLKGYSFKLACKKGANGFITYDPSEAMPQETSIYDNVEDALKDIKENTYRLSEFLKPEAYLTYEELQEKLKWVTFANETKTVQMVQTQDLTSKASEVQNLQAQTKPSEVHETSQASQTSQATKADDLSALLAGLV